MRCHRPNKLLKRARPLSGCRLRRASRQNAVLHSHTLRWAVMIGWAPWQAPNHSSKQLAAILLVRLQVFIRPLLSADGPWLHVEPLVTTPSLAQEVSPIANPSKPKSDPGLNGSTQSTSTDGSGTRWHGSGVRWCGHQPLLLAIAGRESTVGVTARVPCICLLVHASTGRPDPASHNPATPRQAQHAVAFSARPESRLP